MPALAQALVRLEAALRELHAATAAVQLAASLSHAPISSGASLSALAVAELVCAEFPGLTVDRLFSATRVQPVALARQLVLTLCREHTGHTQREIGAAFGFTHGAVVKACQTIADRLATDARFATRYTRLSAQVVALVASSHG